MTWEVADHASMPSVETLIAEGGRGTLTSTAPPVTCPAWPSYLTGKEPHNHKVFDFASLDEDNSVSLNKYEDIQSPTLIDVMHQNNVPSIFFEIPITYPAPSGTPTVISGYPSSHSQEKFSSQSLKEDLEDRFGEMPSINPVQHADIGRDSFREQIFEAADYRFQAFRYLLNQQNWMFATINFHLPDQAGHKFWDEFEDRPSQNSLVNAYEYLDETLGRLLEDIDDKTNVILISDHGHGAQHQTINLNYWLLQNGFLHLENHPVTKLKEMLTKVGLTPYSLKHALETTNLIKLLPNLNRKKRDQILDNFLTFNDINFERSEAFALGHVGQIYWIGNEQTRQQELHNKLESLSAGGEELVTEVIPLRDPETSGSPSKNEPIWLLNMTNWSTIAYPLFLGRWTLLQEATDAGCHRPDGIIGWNGPDLTLRNDPIHGNIIDVAPTIHRLMGLPPQSDFDGRVLKEMIAENAPDPCQPVDYRSTKHISDQEDDTERVEQLKNLGYL